MHDLAVAFDDEALSHFDRARRGDAADVVAAQVQQHQMFGPLLGIGQQLRLQGLVRLGRGAAPAGAGQGADCDLAVLQPDQDLRAGPGQLEALEVQIEQIGRRVLATQRPVEGERIFGPGGREAVAEHDLEDVACGDVVLGLGHHLAEAGLIHGGGEGRGGRLLGGGAHRQGVAQARFEGVQPGDGGVESLTRRGAGVGIGGRDQDDLLPDGIEDGDQGRTGEHGVRQIQRIRIGLAQRLEQAHHVIAEDAEQTGGHGRQVLRQVELRRGDQGAQGLKRGQGLGDETPLDHRRATRQFRRVRPATPDHVRVQRQDRIAALHGAAFDGFQQTGVGAMATQFQIGRNRRLKVVDDAPDQHLRPTGRKAGGEGVEIGPVETRGVLAGRGHCAGAAGAVGSADRPRA